MNDSFRSQHNQVETSSRLHTRINVTGMINKINEMKRINDFPVEILRFIFQQVVDVETAEMQKSFPSYPPGYTRILPLPARLVLVCKYWKDVVYDGSLSSRYLWSTLWLDFRKSWSQLRAETERSLSFLSSENPAPVPLDLFLLHLQAPFTPASLPITTHHTNYTSLEGLLLSLRRIPHHPLVLRSLSMHSCVEGRYVPSEIYKLPSLANLCYFHFDWLRANQPSLRPDRFIWMMPRLEELKLRYSWATLLFKESDNGNPALACLRRLELHPSGEMPSTNFFALLWHTPNLEHLRLKGRVALSTPPPPARLLTLSRLHTIHLYNRRLLPYPLVANWIKTPALSELVVDGTNRPGLVRLWKWEKFLRLNPTITNLSFLVKAGYSVFFSGALTIQHLVLDAERSTGNGWLRHLRDAEVYSMVQKERLPICPNLRTLTILLGPIIPSQATFETFVRSRCTPIDTEGNTETGYKAMEFLILRILIRHSSTVQIIESWLKSDSWGKADIKRERYEETIDFRMRWSYKIPSFNS